ncbi:hypothetical protein [Caminibacter sp.]
MVFLNINETINKYYDILIEDIERKIHFECGTALLKIKNVSAKSKFVIDLGDGNDYSVSEVEYLEFDKYDIELEILSIDTNKISDESYEDIKNFSSSLKENDEVIANLLEEIIYDNKLETMDEEELLLLIIETIKDELNSCCYDDFE